MKLSLHQGSGNNRRLITLNDPEVHVRYRQIQRRVSAAFRQFCTIDEPHKQDHYLYVCQRFFPGQVRHMPFAPKPVGLVWPFLSRNVDLVLALIDDSICGESTGRIDDFLDESTQDQVSDLAFCHFLESPCVRISWGE